MQPQPDCSGNQVGSVGTAGEFDRKHRSAARVPHPADGSVLGEQSRQRPSVVLPALHPQGKGAQPRSASQVSIGPGIDPCRLRRACIRSNKSSSRVTATPSTTSECPDSSFVAL